MKTLCTRSCLLYESKKHHRSTSLFYYLFSRSHSSYFIRCCLMKIEKVTIFSTYFWDYVAVVWREYRRWVIALIFFALFFLIRRLFYYAMVLLFDDFSPLSETNQKIFCNICVLFGMRKFITLPIYLLLLWIKPIAETV